MQLVVTKDVSTTLPISKIRRLFELISEDEAEPDAVAVVNLVFVSHQKIRKLNRDFRSIDKTTDVLSFNVDEQNDPDGVFGEIYICTTRAATQARQYDGTLAGEYLRLFCHGILHLFGYDHKKTADTNRMQSKEKKYLKLIGLEF